MTDGPVIYWMSRDQRIHDNWAFQYAQELSVKFNQPMVVVFCLVSGFPGAGLRQYDFLIKGLMEVQVKLKELNIPFFLLLGNPSETLPQFIHKNSIKHLVSDFDPLKIKREWKSLISNKIDTNHYEVDAHNIVPCRIASGKCEFGAYTIRPKINRLLPDFLDEFKSPEKQKKNFQIDAEETNWDMAMKFINADPTVAPIKSIKPGVDEANNALKHFLEAKLSNYSEKRNNPNADATSGLSAYLHFGQISAQRIALEILKNPDNNASSAAFLEELIVRRELSDNYCFYNPQYDSFGGFPEWARKTLDAHRADVRAYLYDFNTFELGKTHDDLWNAAQMEMVKSGKMHGYMRMYWAKKILEWTRSPEEALDFSIRLNDRYQLDGRDPNGYVGCAWSIGGVHDRAWTERPVFGKIRFMNFNGCKRKFDVNSYISRWL